MPGPSVWYEYKRRHRSEMRGDVRGEPDALDETHLKPVVYVVEDDRGARDAITTLVSSLGIRAESFESGDDFLARGPLPEVPSCLVLDVRMPGLSGLELQSRLVSEGVVMPIVFVSGHPDVASSVQAMKAGAIEFLTKPFAVCDLLDAVQLGIDRCRIQRAQRAQERELQARYLTLTPRQREVMALVVTGLLNKQVAGELGIREITVKIQRGRVMQKMGARSLPELVRMADRLGIGPTRL
jgi:FixJ family two-component response regulator